MGDHKIKLFMWGYQPHFRILLERLATASLKELGADVEVKALLVGVLMAGRSNANPICVEPENGEWCLSIFNGLHSTIQTAVADHQLNNMFYGDQPSNDEKPEIIHRDSIKSSVLKSLVEFDSKNNVQSFCGQPNAVGDYYVVPVLQIPKVVFELFPPLKLPVSKDDYLDSRFTSLIHAAIDTVLEEATKALGLPNPGRSLGDGMRREDEIVRIAARRFMYTPGKYINSGFPGYDTFERFNAISSLLYEGERGVGKIILTASDNPRVEFILHFKEPVPFQKPRWVRKILQMASDGVALIADNEMIYGLGRLSSDAIDDNLSAFLIDFVDHYHWELSINSQVLLRSNYRVPMLPQKILEPKDFLSNYARTFPGATVSDGEHAWMLFCAAAELGHGSMMVISTDADIESIRLAQQGTPILPTILTKELLKRVSDVDGTILLDPYGMCYAIGVILDGEASTDCTPSRGSRFNSASRYVHAAGVRRLAIVVSDDHTVDIIPELRLQVSLTLIEDNILKLESSDLDTYHKARTWLDRHRFYLNDEQCKRVNIALDRLEKLPSKVGQIVIVTAKFQIHKNWDESYITNNP